MFEKEKILKVKKVIINYGGSVLVLIQNQKS